MWSYNLAKIIFHLPLCSLYACVSVYVFFFVFFLFCCLLSFVADITDSSPSNDLIEYLNNILNTPETFSHIYSSTAFLNTSVPCCFILLEFSKLLLYFLVFKTQNLCNIYINFFCTILVLFIDIFPDISIYAPVHQHKFLPCYLFCLE